MYNSVPEKYLPDRIVDNVGYFPDGRYQFVLEGQQQLSPLSTGSYVANYPIVQTSSTTSPLGVRTLRNLVVVIDPQVAPTETSYFFISAELVVKREGLTTVTQSGKLDATYDIQSIDANEYAELGVRKLIYPDELKLNSGDTVVLVLNARVFPATVQFQLRFPIRTSFFIKFN